MFEEATKNFEKFDIVMKMNVLITAENLCKELFEEYPDLEDDCGAAIDRLRMIIDYLDEELH